MIKLSQLINEAPVLDVWKGYSLSRLKLRLSALQKELNNRHSIMGRSVMGSPDNKRTVADINRDIASLKQAIAAREAGEMNDKS